MWSRPSCSPGYTVASLPPSHKKVDPKTEITPSFVDDVFRYLSLQYESVALKFDPELALYTGLSVEEVRKDRKRALGMYCHRWIDENPEFLTGEHVKGGLW